MSIRAITGKHVLRTRCTEKKKWEKARQHTHTHTHTSLGMCNTEIGHLLNVHVNQLFTEREHYLVSVGGKC